MINQQLFNYVKQQLDRNIPKETIKDALMAAGWPTADIEEVFRSLTSEVRTEIESKPQPLAQPQIQPQITAQPQLKPMEPQINIRPQTQVSNEPQARNPLAGIGSGMAGVASKTTMKPIKKSPRVLAVAILVIVLFLLAGGGVYVYLNYFQAPTPEAIVSKMMEKLTQVNYGEYSADINFESNQNLLGDLSAAIPIAGFNLPGSTSTSSSSTSQAVTQNSVSVSGSYDLSDLNNIKNTLDLTGTLGPPNNSTSSTSTYSLGFSLTNVDNVMYFRLNDFSGLSSAFNFLKSQWVKIDWAGIRNQLAPIIQSSISTSTTSTTLVQAGQSLSAEKISAIKTAISQSQILKIAQNLGKENINNVSVYHYKVIIDKDALKNLVLNAANIVNGRDSNQQKTDDFNNWWNNNASNIPNLIDIWIGSSDYLPYRILTTSEIKQGDKLLGTGTLTISFKNFNQPATIQAPTEFKTIEDITLQLFMGSSKTSTSTAKTGTSTPKKK